MAQEKKEQKEQKDRQEKFVYGTNLLSKTLSLRIRDLDRVLDISGPTISSYRTGRRPISSISILKLESALRKYCENSDYQNSQKELCIEESKKIPKLNGILVELSKLSQKLASDSIDDITILGISACVENISNNLKKISSEILDKREKLSIQGNSIPSAAFEIEVRGYIAAGAPECVESEPCKIRVNAPVDRDVFVARVCGQSMEPVIPDGSYVLLKPWSESYAPKAGTIVAYTDHRGNSIKCLSFDESGKPVLMSVNPKFPDVIPLEDGSIVATYIDHVINPAKV